MQIPLHICLTETHAYIAWTLIRNCIIWHIGIWIINKHTFLVHFCCRYFVYFAYCIQNRWKQYACLPLMLKSDSKVTEVNATFCGAVHKVFAVFNSKCGFSGFLVCCSCSMFHFLFLLITSFGADNTCA